MSIERSETTSSPTTISLRLAYRMVDMLHLTDEDTFVIPLANEGELARPIFSVSHKPICQVPRLTVLVDPDKKRCTRLKQAIPNYEEIAVIVATGDFLTMPNSLMEVTAVALGPPESPEKDIARLVHAWNLLKPGGRLVAVCDEEAFLGHNEVSDEFASFLDATEATHCPVSPDCFSPPMSARLVYLQKPSD